MLLMKSMPKDEDDNDEALWDTLAELGKWVPEKEASDIAKALVKAILEKKRLGQFPTLEIAMKGVGTRVSKEAATAIANALVAAMGSESDAKRLSALGNSLASLGKQLPHESAENAAGHLVRAIQKTRDSTEIYSLGGALAALGEWLPKNEAGKAAQHLLALIENESDISRIDAMTDSFSGLGEWLPVNEVAKAARKLGELIKTESDYYTLAALARSLTSVRKRLPENAAAEVVQKLVAVMLEKSNNTDWPKVLGPVISDLGMRLSTTDAAAVVQQLVAVMLEKSENYDWSILGPVISSLGTRLSTTDAAAVAKKLLAAIQSETRPDNLVSLREALRGVATHLSQDAAAKYANELVEAMAYDAKDTKKLPRLVLALAALGKRVPPTSEARAAATLVKSMPKAESKEDDALWDALAELGKCVPEKEAPEIATKLVKAMEKDVKDKNVAGMILHGRALASLGQSLNKTQADSGAKSVMAVMEYANDWEQLRLAWVLATMSERLNTETIRTAIDQVLILLATRGRYEFNLVKQFTIFINHLDTNQELVEILKHPLCIGRSRFAVLKVLEKKTNSLFHDQHDEFEVKLMSVKDDSEIPLMGKSLVIVARANNQLYFRIIDAEGKTILKKGEKEIRNNDYEIRPIANDEELANLKRYLDDFWNYEVLPKETQATILELVAPMLDYTLLEYDIWMLVDRAAKLQLDLNTVPKRPHEPTETASGAISK